MTATTLSKKTSILLIIFITVFAIAPSAVIATTYTISGGCPADVPNWLSTVNLSWSDGDTLSFEWEFISGEVDTDYNDTGGFKLVNYDGGYGPGVKIKLCNVETIGGLGSSGWNTYTDTLSGSSTNNSFQIYTTNNKDCAVPSTLKVKNIQVVSVGHNPPVANDDSITVDEGGTVTVLDSAATSVLVNDTDADANPLTAVLDSGPIYGVLTLNSNGTFSYTHNGSENFSDSFTYYANDGTNNSLVAATVTITVNPVNDAPMANNDGYSTDEDTALNISASGVLGNDSDIEGNPLSAVLVDNVGNGTLTLNADGSFTYTPISNGSDSFTYQADDQQAENNLSNIATVTITISDTAPTAAFSANVTSGNEPLTVNFTDSSTAYDMPMTWSWNFGDGSPADTTQNPSHTYTQEGTYTVTLTVTDSDGTTNTATTTITVLDTDPSAAFTATPSSGDEPLTVSFTNTTVSYDPLDTWTWDYGDGTTSSEHQNPSHIYTQEGTYTVTLIMTQADGDTNTATSTIAVNDTDPAPAFTANPTSGDEPLTVSFTDDSSSYDGIVSRSWDFGDGSAASTDQNPDHTYAQDGSYTVTFTVTEGDGDAVSTTGTISVTDPGPTADFLATPTSGEVPLIVNFTYQSTSPADGIVSLTWDFGDGSPLSSVQNPSHTYNAAGTYTVTLTVYESDNDSDTATATVTVSTPAVDTDNDNDGWYVSQGDCDDNNAGINPGATEICGDGIDQDCFDGDRTCPGAGAGCLDIADSPLETRISAASPNIMFVIDDSESMDWEFLTDDDDGMWWLDNKTHVYLFDTEDNISLGYQLGGTGSQEDPEDRKRWKSQCFLYNKVYYNPESEYEPWEGMSDANVNTPLVHPKNTAAYTNPTFDLNAVYFSLGAAGGSGIIIDDLDSGFDTTSSPITWDEDEHADAYDSYYRVATDPAGDYTATWTPTLPQAGDYEVWIRWVYANKRSTSVSYTINHDGGSDTVDVNQGVDREGAWYQLGTYTFDGSGTENVSVSATISTKNVDTVCADAVKFVPAGAPTGAVDVINAHYFVWSDSANKAYLVNLDGAIDYYEVVAVDEAAAVTGYTTTTGLLSSSNNIVIALIPEASPPADIVTGRTYAQERQNFANWFQYYRKRWFTVVAAVTRVIPNLEGVNIGYRTINGNGVQPVVPIKVPGESDYTNTIIDALEEFELQRVPGQTPLRSGLEMVGLYYHMTETSGNIEDELEDSPLSTGLGRECQQNFAVILTDGSWNGGAAGGGDADQDNGPPYADDYPNTLADIAMYFYENDLAPDVDDEVPTNFIDKANWQHMVTYSITFGVNGQLNPDNYDLYNIDPDLRVYPTWPSPLGSDSAAKQAKIDDVWHAAVNGRGKYLSADNPQELIAYFQDIMNDLMARVGSGSSVTINGEELEAGTIVYQTVFNTEGWTGDVKGYSIDADTGEVIRDSYVWSAEEKLYDTNWDTGRIIATYNGTDAGIEFRYNSLTTAQQSLLDSNATTAQNMVNYLRGDSSLEVKNSGSFRNRDFKLPDQSTRDSKLGDIVHSSPVFQKYITGGGTEYGVVFAGGNDGMLHAFDADTGQERFAYIPNLVFENLKNLTQTGYSHQYYVDLTPYLKNADGTVYLVGGLGKGGKGYYCLDMSDPSSITSESDLAGKVMWEFPKSSTPQSHIDYTGYSFSRAFIAKTYDPAHPWVVIFGNGYNSPNENAALIILDVDTGDVVKIIDTEVGGCNGLSTPVLIDVNNDQAVDYVYAGDLKGNLWKFDLTAANAFGIGGNPGWEVAYDDGSNPKPVFTAKDNSGNVQPITAKPDVMRPCGPALPGYFVIFGTGKYLGLSDFSNTSVQTVYGIWDYGDDPDDSEYLGEFNRTATSKLSNQPNTVILLEQEEFYYGIPDGYASYMRVLTNNPFTYETEADTDGGQYPNPSSTVANHAGWYFDLPITKERMIKDFFIRSGKAIYISNIPNTSACAAGGDSILHEVNACTGGRLTTPQFDINDDDIIDANDLITIELEGVTYTVAPTGLWYPTILYPPSILDTPNEEIKFMSTAAGGIIDIRETGEQEGIFYWYQIE
jgi:VCBS repeat-containing protein